MNSAPHESTNAPLVPNAAPSWWHRFTCSIARFLGCEPNTPTFHESVAELLEEHDAEGTKIGSEERTMLSNLLQLGERRTADIMVPRSDILAIEETATLSEIHHMFMESGHTRLPVFRDSLDHVLGFLHIKDVVHYLGTEREFSADTAMRKILFVSPSMKVLDLMARMQTSRVHIAIVLDEYGGTDGLVTLEDMMEEIVGEIEDEHDDAESLSDITTVNNNQYDVSARVTVAALEERLHLTLKSEKEAGDYDTIGGLIFSLLGHVPAVGEAISHPKGVTFTILEADSHRIKRVRVSRK